MARRHADAQAALEALITLHPRRCRRAPAAGDAAACGGRRRRGDAAAPLHRARAALAEFAETDARPDRPLLVRPVGLHGGDDLVHIEHRAELAAYAERVPADAYYVPRIITAVGEMVLRRIAEHRPARSA